MRPEDVQEIVGAFGDVLAEATATGVVRDTRSLPYPKSEIKAALRVALNVTTDLAMRDHLKAAYVALADFQLLSDREVLALQLWNDALSKSSSATAAADVINTVAAEGDAVIAVQRRVADEAGSLLRELAAAGV